MKIAVLAGGLSPERDVSLTSGSLIANALSKAGHSVALLDVYKNADTSDINSLFLENTEHSFSVEESAPDLETVIAQNGGRRINIGDGVLDVCRAADVVFLALHGAMGENGQLQATLDNYGIHRYTGSDYVGSLLAMDKDISKKMLRSAGITTADWVMLRDGSAESVARAEAEIGYPCVVKPNSCGSSVGVSIVHDRKQLEKALSDAAKYEQTIMCEKKISGREMTFGILDGEVLPAIEIIPTDGFYDYKNKYQSGKTVELCPAPITDEEYAAMAEATRRGFDALRLGMYARFDFIISSEDGKPYCLEANTLPGMTPTSLLPQMAAAVGLGYTELCERLCELAMKKGK